MVNRWPEPITTGPLERTPGSPRWKSRESNGVGLGIVVALDKSNPIKNMSNIILSSHCVTSTPATSLGPTLPSNESRNYTDAEVHCDGLSKRSSFSFRDVTCYDDGFQELGFFCASPPRLTREFSGFPTAGFLKYCNLCRKKLDGKDIYMYRGETAFCSMDCRYRQIVADEYQESCGYGVSRTVEISASVCSGRRPFFDTGIMAA